MSLGVPGLVTVEVSTVEVSAFCNLASARQASEHLKKAYVHAGQEIDFRLIRSGANGKEIQQKILALFAQRGLPTARFLCVLSFAFIPVTFYPSNS